MRVYVSLFLLDRHHDDWSCKGIVRSCGWLTRAIITPSVLLISSLLFLLVLTAGNLITIAPYLLGILLVVILAWMGSVKALSKLYNEKIKGD